ncbi:PREDICTED: cytospin-B-like [Rhinopithecus bieti]|uniref:cytospin-B-like n=1 Tax=Rhinopithecus bieti TaxID=61621 RepID=UPI00083BE7CA|nr:PREDICTED: cytospin-B-like [Rhinopithecus bieti]
MAEFTMLTVELNLDQMHLIYSLGALRGAKIIQRGHPSLVFRRDRPAKTNMRSAAKPWSPAIRAGGHGPDRARPLPAASSGMKNSKSSTSLAFESRLSRLKRASSEDTLNKPGSTTASGVARLKKTATAGAISELAESRLRSGTGRRDRAGGTRQAFSPGHMEALQ